ncbi:SagB/ThcOx family dehydrogenase [Natronospora cellulosivora (SeqCode)]
MNICKEFMEKTKYQNMKEESPQEKGVEQPPLQKPYEDGLELIDLPEPTDLELENINLKDLFEQRRSLRSYSDQELSQEELSYLLWMTQGVKKEVKDKATFRTVPSAGARHAFETYLLINNVDGLDNGIYRYLAIEHKLLPYKFEDKITEKVVEACLKQKFVGESAITFIWVADVERMTWRYQERSYRYLHLDAGHVCQNLYLASESIDAGVCAIAAYSDDAINELLEIDGQNEFVIYMATVGKK